MYAITGATGHTGNVIAKRLIDEGKQVRAIGRDRDRLAAIVGAEPFVCDITDAVALGKAFAGAEAVYLVIPADMASKNIRAYQERVIDRFASALAVADVKYAVILSSVGADKTAKTGPVVGLHNLEKRIGIIDGLNVMSLRAGYFMENTLAQTSIIQHLDKAAGPLAPDLKLPMIASRDIGNVAADLLLRLDFTGHQTRELLGQRDLTMTEAASIIGQSIGRPALHYVQLSDEECRAAMSQMGMSSNMISAILEMSAALNTGHMRSLEPRSKENTTATTFEQFVREVSVPAYEGRMAHA